MVSCQSVANAHVRLMEVQVLDFGASRDGVTEAKRGKRMVVDIDGVEISDASDFNRDNMNHNTAADE